VLEQLRRTIAGVRARSMFGGVGVYAGDLFFALMDDDTLYLKADDSTRGRFEARGLGPFRPGGESGEVMQYYEVPGEVLEDVELLAPWIEEAVAVADRAKRRRSERRSKTS
jgi:DNA transformation protein and related proteins